MSLLPITYEHYNIIDKGEEELIYTYCEHFFQKEGYHSIEEMISDVSSIEFFPNVTFHALLEDFYNEQNKDIEEEVRGYAPHYGGFLMTHGGNYDWLSIDLFGDNNGVNKFEKWLENKGMVLSCEDYF